MGSFYPQKRKKKRGGEGRKTNLQTQNKQQNMLSDRSAKVMMANLVTEYHRELRHYRKKKQRLSPGKKTIARNIPLCLSLRDL